VEDVNFKLARLYEDGPTPDQGILLVKAFSKIGRGPPVMVYSLFTYETSQPHKFLFQNFSWKQEDPPKHK